MPLTIGNDSDKGSYNPPRFCNCKRSNCLKLYCECFGYGVLCQPGSCNCYSCQNNADNELLRNSTMESILERNPNAFRPKADVLKRADSVQVVHKGCFCKKSNCLKKYCECFQAEIVCCELCRCADCKNFEGSAALKKLVGDASAALQATTAVSNAASYLSGVNNYNSNSNWSAAMLSKCTVAKVAPHESTSIAAASSSSSGTRVQTQVKGLRSHGNATDYLVSAITDDDTSESLKRSAGLGLGLGLRSESTIDITSEMKMRPTSVSIAANGAVGDDENDDEKDEEEEAVIKKRRIGDVTAAATTRRSSSFSSSSFSNNRQQDGFARFVESVAISAHAQQQQSKVIKNNVAVSSSSVGLTPTGTKKEEVEEADEEKEEEEMSEIS